MTRRSARRVAQLRWLCAALLAGAIAGCIGMPDEVAPVEEFDAQRYLGRWYEIARLDHSFERDLVSVTAEYSFRGDGALRVRNRGYNVVDREWDEAEGVARFVEREDLGHLKVSFFGPFYGSYVVFEVDRDDYSYAFVSGFNHDYLWLLSREPVITDELKARFERAAAARGFDTAALIWVDQSPPEPPE